MVKLEKHSHLKTNKYMPIDTIQHFCEGHNQSKNTYTHKKDRRFYKRECVIICGWYDQFTYEI